MSSGSWKTKDQDYSPYLQLNKIFQEGKKAVMQSK